MRLQSRYQSGDKIGGRYQVHQALMGGMGEVYLCLDLETIQPYALKTFQQRYLTNPKVRELFKEEVATWVALEKHPNIVRCFYMDIIDNQPFMFLEWIAGDESRGTDLRSWLRHGPLDLRLALDFTIDICRGLIHAGQKQPGIVHRDLKPENILVAQGRLAKITDWGLAKIVQEAELEIAGVDDESGERQSLLGQGGIVGTPAYMAPEQWCGEELDARTDIYAVGCILYEMLAGTWPFQATTLDSFRRQHLEASIPKLADRQTLPDSLDTLLARCLAKQREERHVTVGDLFQQLAVIYQQQFAKLRKVLPISEEFTAGDYNNRGVTYDKLQRYDEALTDFNRALELNPNFAQAYNNRGNIYCALQRYEEALADYNRSIQFDPTMAQAYSNRGNIYDSLQRYEEALVDHTHAIQLDPTNAASHNNCGSTYENLQRYDEALVSYTCAIDLDLTFVQAYYNRGRVCATLRRYEESLLDSDRVVQLDPANARNYYTRGRIYTELQRHKEALADFSRAIQLDPDDSAAYISRGITYYTLQHYKEALADYDRAIQFDPTLAQVYYNRGLTYNRLRRYEEALKDFTQALKLDSAFAQAYNDRGNAYARLQRYNEALMDQTRSLQLDPTNATAYFNRGLTYEKLQRYDEALADYNQAVQLDPALALAHLNIGALLANRGMLLDALAHFEKAAQLGLPQGAHYAAQVRTRLAIETFQQAGSPDEIRHGVAQFPFMADAEFIAAIEQTIAQRVPLEHQPALEQRLAWLRQIAEEQKREARDQ